MSGPSGVAAAAVTVAANLFDAHVQALVQEYGRLGSYSHAAAESVGRVLPVSHRSLLDPLTRAWATEPALPGVAVALALETAVSAKRAARIESVEVVVTGPDSPAAPVRLTSEVVKQLIDSARERVTLVSYAAYQIPSVVAALDIAAARGVRIDLILESPEHLDGGGGAAAYAKYRIYEWPADQRVPPDAKLHAKAVIVDSRDVLLTSANMTNAAYDKNIEVGVLCRGGTTASRIQRHFDALIARGCLRLTN